MPERQLSIAEIIAARKQQLADIRDYARSLLADGAGGLQIASLLSGKIDVLLVEMVQTVAGSHGFHPDDSFWQDCSVVAVGGTGRGELCPYSDIDLLFLSERPNAEFAEIASAVVRDCWDFGLKLGHTVQTVAEARTVADEEIQFVTSLVSARALFGNGDFVGSFRNRLLREVIRRRQLDFIRACVTSRQEEREQAGQAVKQLEPDLKRAPGGLRDVHLMQWIAFAVAEVSDLEGIRLRELVPAADAAMLAEAYEFLTRLRIDLHLHNDRPHDVLTRDDQLRIADQRQIESDNGQRPVERFMQTYFQHSTNIADISRQFVNRHQPPTLRARVLGPLASHRFNKVCVMRPEGIDVVGRHKQRVCADIDETLNLFLASLLYDVDPIAEVLERIRLAVPGYPRELSVTSGKLFRKILRSAGDLSRVLRTMYRTGLLEHIIPNFAHTRGLIQFNHYHSYTVDEHTLRAIEAAVRFRDDPGKVGSAYRAVRHKASLHLAILLHDVGKGFERDHSELGAEIANAVGPRLSMSPHKQEMVSFLVLNHLKMSHLALRRDISDTQLVIEFAREVGSPERLRMLYVLTAADITAVGPGVFNDWKAELLGELYSRAMEVLSGRPEKHLENERIARARGEITAELAKLTDGPIDTAWLDRELSAMPVFYLTGEIPACVAQDLLRLQAMTDDNENIEVWGSYSTDTDIVEYRVISQGKAALGCFHRIAGTLAALRMDILSAGICTTRDGTAIDAFRVTDNDYEGEVPQIRLDEVAAKIRDVLARKTTVEKLQTQRNQYVLATARDVSELKPRVVIDNDCSRAFTVIDVFAYDRPGLLYALTRALHELDLSIQLARIGTHWDQVVDVFYVTDFNDRKIRSGEVTDRIRTRLLEVIEEVDEEQEQA